VLDSTPPDGDGDGNGDGNGNGKATDSPAPARRMNGWMDAFSGFCSLRTPRGHPDGETIPTAIMQLGDARFLQPTRLGDHIALLPYLYIHPSILHRLSEDSAATSARVLRARSQWDNRVENLRGLEAATGGRREGRMTRRQSEQRSATRQKDGSSALRLLFAPGRENIRWPRDGGLALAMIGTCISTGERGSALSRARS